MLHHVLLRLYLGSLQKNWNPLPYSCFWHREKYLFQLACVTADHNIFSMQYLVHCKTLPWCFGDPPWGKKNKRKNKTQTTSYQKVSQIIFLFLCTPHPHAYLYDRAPPPCVLLLKHCTVHTLQCSQHFHGNLRNFQAVLHSKPAPGKKAKKEKKGIIYMEVQGQAFILKKRKYISVTKVKVLVACRCPHSSLIH